MRFIPVLPVALVFLSICSSKGQELTFLAEINYGTFSMASLKAYQKSSDFSVPLQAVEDFPSFPGYKAYSTFRFREKINIGMFVGLHSTGGRSAYGDYSGKITYDITCLGIGVGPMVEYEFWSYRNYLFYGVMASGISFNRIDSDYQMEIGNYQVVKSERFKGTNVIVAPALAVKRIFGKIPVRFYAGYELSLWSDLKSTRENRYLISNGDFVKVQWTGFRVGLGMGLNRTMKGRMKPKATENIGL